MRGESRYLADLADLDRPHLHAVFVRSMCAAGRIRRIDVAVAQIAPGVVAVARAGEMGLPLDAPLPGIVEGVRRPLLAHDVVRHVGEPVAVVVATSLAAAVDAAELVVVEIEPGPVVASPAVALAPGAVRVHEAMADNVYRTGAFGDGRDVLAGAEVVIEAAMVSQRVAAAPMEPNGVLAVPGDPEGGVTLWASSQFVHGVQREVAESLGLRRSSVRVVHPQVGGGFGPKFETAPEYVAVAALALATGRAVRWQETRSENLVSMPHGRGHHQRAWVGVAADGRVAGLRVRVATDAGAYPISGAGSPVGTGVLMVPGPYAIDAVDVEVRTVATNTPPVGVYRGPGRAEPNYLRERVLDLAALELGIDPVEIRRRNLLRREQLPHRSVTGFTYDSGDYVACLDAAIEAAGYDSLRREQQRRREAHDPVQLGIGVACWLDVTPRNRAGEWASLRLSSPDGGEGLEVEVLAGTCDHGQGHATTWGLILSGVLGVPVECVRLAPTDTARVPRGDGTGSARSLQLTGSTLTVAARIVLEQARALGAHLLEANVGDLVVVDGGLAVRGTPARNLSWPQLVRAAADPSLPAEVRAAVPDGVLGASADVDQDGPTFPFGVHLAVVEVDVETGAVRLLRHVAVDDCGTVVNPVVVEGQQHGGIAQGVAQALFEHAVFDDDGTPMASTLLDYRVPAATELPSFEVSTIESPSPVNVLGAKGIGQGGAIGAPAAVVNAVCDALAPFGVRHLDMPITPESVARALGRC